MRDRCGEEEEIVSIFAVRLTRVDFCWLGGDEDAVFGGVDMDGWSSSEGFRVGKGYCGELTKWIEVLLEGEGRRRVWLLR